MLFARDFRALARDRLRGCFWAVALVTLVAGLLGGTLYGQGAVATNVEFSYENGFTGVSESYSLEEALQTAMDMQSSLPFQLLASYGLIVFLIGGAVSVGLCRYNLALLDRRERSMRTLWTGFQLFGRALWLRFLVLLFTFLWTLLFIIPGVIASYRYSMAFFVLAEDPEITAREALNVSKRMMRGNKRRLFCLNLSFIGWSLLAALPALVCVAVGAAAAISTLNLALYWPPVIAGALVTWLLALLVQAYSNAAVTAFFLDVSGQAHRLSGAPQPDAQPAQDAQPGQPDAQPGQPELFGQQAQDVRDNPPDGTEL